MRGLVLIRVLREVVDVELRFLALERAWPCWVRRLCIESECAFIKRAGKDTF